MIFIFKDSTCPISGRAAEIRDNEEDLLFILGIGEGTHSECEYHRPSACQNPQLWRTPLGVFISRGRTRGSENIRGEGKFFRVVEGAKRRKIGSSRLGAKGGRSRNRHEATGDELTEAGGC